MMFLVYLFVAAQAAAVTSNNKGNHPVSKVVNLLKDMQTQLAKEGEEDQEVYEKITCWCTTNDADKTKAISDAEARITDLTSTIEEETASSSRLTTEIKNLEEEIAANNAALDKATALRTKELAEFNSEEKDMLQSIGALKSAVTVLGKHNPALIQVSQDPNALVTMAAMLQDQFRKHADIVNQIATPSQHEAVAAFAKAPNDFFDGALLQTKQAPSAGSYAGQSGAIFGIISQMKETFETNLANSQKEEQNNVAAYTDLKKAKENEISAGENQRDVKTQELADSGMNLAQAKQDLEDTRNSLSADQTFLMNLKQTCATTESEYDARTKTRQEEIVACGEALSILNSDDARDQFSATFNFVQVESDSRREQVANILSDAGKKFNNHHLSALAMSAKNEAFAKLITDIDGMIEGLNQEKADDIKMKDFCLEEISKNERAQTLKARDIKKSEAKVNMLEAQIGELTKSINKLNKEIEEMRVQLKRAGEDREAENSDFQTVIADQRATQKLLTSALGVLQGVYEKKALLQTSNKSGPPPPAGFKTYEKQGGAGGVLGMLEQIIGEAKALEAEAITGEADAQKAYESFVKDSNKSLEEKNRDLINKTAAKAQAEADLVATQEALEAQNTEQKHNEQENTDLHNSCDFTLKNFDMRQEALSAEAESLRQAKSILSGSTAGFLQKN